MGMHVCTYTLCATSKVPYHDHTGPQPCPIRFSFYFLIDFIGVWGSKSSFSSPFLQFTFPSRVRIARIETVKPKMAVFHPYSGGKRRRKTGNSGEKNPALVVLAYFLYSGYCSYTSTGTTSRYAITPVRQENCQNWPSETVTEFEPAKIGQNWVNSDTKSCTRIQKEKKRENGHLHISLFSTNQTIAS